LELAGIARCGRAICCIYCETQNSTRKPSFVRSENAISEKYYSLFQKEYLQLADNLSDYVYRLMNEVQTDVELDWILNKTEDTETDGQLARIKLAVENGEKYFVAHPSCQQKLTETWFQGVRSVSNSSWRLFVIFVVYLFFSPFIGLYYVLAPKSKVRKITVKKG
jgi:hypothetical protein